MLTLTAGAKSYALASDVGGAWRYMLAVFSHVLMRLAPKAITTPRSLLRMLAACKAACALACGGGSAAVAHTLTPYSLHGDVPGPAGACCMLKPSAYLQTSRTRELWRVPMRPA